VPSLNVYVICVAADIFPFLTDSTDDQQPSHLSLAYW
jgi:hypothetical protein